MIKKILKSIFILQEVSNKNRYPKLGRGFLTARRLNPYNPLSYVFCILLVIFGIILYGIIGVWEELSPPRNPFKWD